MHSYLETILTITAEAEAIPRRYFRQALDIETKLDASPVTIADKMTEEFIRAAIARNFPDHSIYGEEFGQSKRSGQWQWIIDPIDGTRSFISGLPIYGMLIALLKDGIPVLGVVRMPELGEVYTGSAQGAFLNGKIPLKTAQTTSLAQAFLYINEGEKQLAGAPKQFHRLLSAGRDRRLGYDCYPHALVASGYIDACIDYDLKPYDYMPLVAVVQAAGGVISDWQGTPLGMDSGGRVVSAATKELHREILDLLN